MQVIVCQIHRRRILLLNSTGIWDRILVIFIPVVYVFKIVDRIDWLFSRASLFPSPSTYYYLSSNNYEQETSYKGP